MAFLSRKSRESSPQPLLYRFEDLDSLVGTRHESKKATIQYLQKQHPELKDRAEGDFIFRANWKDKGTYCQAALVAEDAWKTVVTDNAALTEITVILVKSDTTSADDHDDETSPGTMIKRKMIKRKRSEKTDSSGSHDEPLAGLAKKSKKTKVLQQIALPHSRRQQRSLVKAKRSKSRAYSLPAITGKRLNPRQVVSSRERSGSSKSSSLQVKRNGPRNLINGHEDEDVDVDVDDDVDPLYIPNAVASSSRLSINLDMEVKAEEFY